jgi:PAS domain S-box-containing protein
MRVCRLIAFIVVCVAVVPSGVFGQAIVGRVNDASGASVPDVTIQAEGSALAEKVRTVFLDRSGQYRIEDLRRGLYAMASMQEGSQRLASHASAAAKPRRILLLHSYDSPFDIFSQAIRRELVRQSPTPLEFLDDWLPPNRLIVSPHEAQSLVEDLRSKNAGRALDLMVAISGPAVVFAQKYRQQLVPATTPLLLSGTDRRFVQEATLHANDTAVPFPFDPPRAIEQILLMRPHTTQIFIVLGAGQLVQFWRSELHREFQRFAGRVTFAWSDDLSYEDMLKRAATLPPNSAILVTPWPVDRDGVQMTADRLLNELHAAADAPIFGLTGEQVGQGIVGGLAGSSEVVARETAAVAVRILRGDRLGGIVLLTLPSEYDSRELRRWNISENRLPPGSIVRFGDLTLWGRYRWPILGVAFVCFGEAVLILELLVNQAKRRRAEGAVRESEERFRLMANTAPVMIWVEDTDKRCTYVNDSWLKFTGRSMEEELGTGWTAGIHPEDLARCLATYTSAFDRRESFRMERRHRRHDGEYRSILAIGVPRYTPNGAFSGYIGSAMDMTDQKLAESALSDLSRKLMRVQEEERAFVARELHDDISQQFAVLLFQLDLLRSSQRVGDRAERLSEAAERAREIAGSIRDLSHRLHPGQLQLIGLVPAIENLRDDFSRSDLSVVFSHGNVPSAIEHDVALCLFRVIQEALNNAVKHGGAAHVWVDLTGEPTGLVLTVTDDGGGFDVEGALSHGLGLTSMRERLQSIGGVLEIHSASGSGTRLMDTVPLAEAMALGKEGWSENSKTAN